MDLGNMLAQPHGRQPHRMIPRGELCMTIGCARLSDFSIVAPQDESSAFLPIIKKVAGRVLERFALIAASLWQIGRECSTLSLQIRKDIIDGS
jgi:hypothetical protein